MRPRIDINCDLGEGMGSDHELLNIVTSANIACGAHAGDEAIMAQTVAAAKTRKVNIGAHPGYRDRENFGRQQQSLDADSFKRLLRSQIDLLNTIAGRQGARVSHIRAHGALGNLTDADPAAARRLVSSLEGYKLALMTLGNSAAEQAARDAGIPVIRQFFADRAYDASGQLVSRTLPGSMIHDEKIILRRLLEALESGTIECHEDERHKGKRIDVTFDTICVHGDTQGALTLAQAIRRSLENNGIAVEPYRPVEQGSQPA